MSVEKKVSAVVVNWNGMKFLPSCLDSLFMQSYKKLEVIVVDCASEDQSVPFIKSNYPLAKVIELRQDLGPPYAINLAARLAEGDYILILNNDVILPEDMLSTLVRKMEEDKGCVLNPVELHWTGEYVSSGCHSVWIGRFLYKLIKLKGDMPFYPSTACCLVPKRIILDNPLNESLFMYEDTEWGWRLHLKEIPLKVVKEAFFFHRGSGSENTSYSAKQAFFMGRAVVATCFICFKIPMLILMLPVILCNYIWQILVYAKRKKLASIISYTAGHLDFFTKLKVFIKERRRVQKERVIGDWSILKIMTGSMDFAKNARNEWLQNTRAKKRVLKEDLVHGSYNR